MIITHKRTSFTPEYTEGKYYIDGKEFCDVLEDAYRDLKKERKVYGETCIPYGEYEVVLSMSGKFGRIMPEIKNVKGFSGIRIHSGNTAHDSLGCQLVGKKDAPGHIRDSRITYNKLMDILEPVFASGEPIKLQIL